MAKLPSFDEMADMAKQDPEGLEALRNRLNQEVIDQARSEAAKRRLTGLKFQIDMELRRAPNAIASCIRMSQMMSESLLKMQLALKGQPIESVRNQTASVVDFSRQSGSSEASKTELETET